MPPGFAALATDRRGATATFFAVIEIALLGVASLATEAGTWYLTRSSADNPADAAAALAASVGADYQSTATAEVLIKVTATPLLSSLFTSSTPVIASRGVALVKGVDPACVLSLLGDL